MHITKKSDYSGKISSREINITDQEYVDYISGKLGFVHDAFPHLSADDREFLISGGTLKEWREMLSAAADDLGDDKDETVDVDTEYDAPPL